MQDTAQIEEKAMDLSHIPRETLIEHLVSEPPPLSKEDIRRVWLTLIERKRQVKTGGHNGGRPALPKNYLTVKIHGETVTKSLREWERETGVRRTTIIHRLEIGATPEEAISKVLRLGSTRNVQSLGKKRALKLQERADKRAKRIAEKGMTERERAIEEKRQARQAVKQAKLDQQEKAKAARLARREERKKLTKQLEAQRKKRLKSKGPAKKKAKPVEPAPAVVEETKYDRSPEYSQE